MKIKGLVDEDFINYKEPSMFIITSICSFKCDKENGCALCQNSALATQPNIEIDKIEIVKRYLDNPITTAIVLGGLEPFDTPLDIFPLIDCLRRQYNCHDTIVIYTGYTEQEIEEKGYLQILKNYGNIIIKYGRYIPNQEKHYDEVLGVYLASDNQYARYYENYTESR